MEEQYAAIRVALHNEDTMAKETEVQYAIGKKCLTLLNPKMKP